MSVEKNDKLTQMKYGEWLASPFGACLVASALGPRRLATQLPCAARSDLVAPSSRLARPGWRKAS